MTDYESLSDFEINKAVAEANLPAIQWCSKQEFIGESPVMGVFSEQRGISKDYCNNPSDAWPIILENIISIRHPSDFGCAGDDWEATCDVTIGDDCLCFGHSDENPLRACMIVFLKMRAGDNE